MKTGTRLRVDANGAPRRLRGAFLVGVFFRAENRWGCLRTGPAPSVPVFGCVVHKCPSRAYHERRSGRPVSSLAVLRPSWRFLAEPTAGVLHGYDHYESVLSSGKQPIFAFWHGRILPATLFWRDRGIVVITSENFDGEWIARIIRRFGYGTARGSSSRGGVRALVQLKRELEGGEARGVRDRWTSRTRARRAARRRLACGRHRPSRSPVPRRGFARVDRAKLGRDRGAFPLCARGRRRRGADLRRWDDALDNRRAPRVTRTRIVIARAHRAGARRTILKAARYQTNGSFPSVFSPFRQQSAQR